MQRWSYDFDNFSKLLPWAKDFIDKLQEIVINESKEHGMGRHSKEEVFTITKKDMTAASSFLGKMFKYEMHIGIFAKY